MIGRKGWRRIEVDAYADRPWRRAYELTPPFEVRGHGLVRYVVADFAVTPDHGPETMLFKADESGGVVDWGDLWCLPHDAVSDDSGIDELVLFYTDDETYGELRKIVTPHPMQRTVDEWARW